MKNTILTGAAAIALAAPAFAGAPVTYTAPAPSNLGLSGDLSLGYQSDYEFRGLVLDGKGYSDNGDRDRAADFDTDVIIADINAKYAFTEQFSAVTGYRLDSLRDAGDQEQTYVGARWATDCYSVEAGYRYIDFSGRSTDEVYLSGGIVCPWTGADLNLLWAHDLDETEGDYIALSARKAFEINEWSSVELGAGVSYSVDYWGDDYDNSSDWNSWNLSLAVPLKATDYLTVTPYVVYTDGLDALDFGDEDSVGDEVIWGVKASVNF